MTSEPDDSASNNIPDHPGWRDPAIGYGRLSRWLHWGFVLLFVVLVPLGLLGANQPIGPIRLVALSVHKAIGIFILLFWLFRMSWRLSQGWPTSLSESRWMQRAAKFNHLAFYVLIPLAVLSGWAYSSAAAFPVSFFGLIELPALLAPDAILAEELKSLHHLIVFTLLALVVLHVIAALYHHCYLKDRTLRRMLRG